MTTEPFPVSDADLMAYLDRSLDAERVADVEACLAADPEARLRLAEWQRQNALIAGLYGPAATEPLPDYLDIKRMAARRQASAGIWLRMAATAVICLGLGAGSGWYVAARQASSAFPATMEQAVAAYHVYAGDAAHPVQVAGNADDVLGAWLSNRLDRRFAIPDLRQAGWTLVGGSVLPIGQKPGALIMYESATGKRMTLLFTPMARGEDSPPRFEGAGALDVMSWSDGRLNCTIVAPVTRMEIRQIGHMVYGDLI